MSLAERFAGKFAPEPNTGCWLWTASVNRKGYGRIGVGDAAALAHRVSWELHRGPIPGGLCVLHKCDVPACVNPDHLFLGTVPDNTADCIAKGRFTAGIRETERSACPRGHPLDGMKKEHGRYHRYCKTCGRARFHARKAIAAERGQTRSGAVEQLVRNARLRATESP